MQEKDKTMDNKKEFRWKDKWNKTKKEILTFLGYTYTISMKCTKGSRDSLRLERNGRRIEIANTLSKTVSKEWSFYDDGGWKTTGYKEFFGISRERDAIAAALSIFAAQSVDSDSFLIRYLEAEK
jgi:hypothetical protein